MAQPPPVFPLTADDYLRWEADQPEKHEYVRGKTFAMGGASRRHVTISLNVASALDEALDGTPSRAYIADMKVQATEDEAYFYPDVLVTCDPADHRADQFMRAPKLIVEVLSPSTEGIDRREKLRAYRTLPSLKEYALVSQDECKLELYRRRGDIGWDIITFEPGDAVEFASVELQMPIADIYFEAGVACSG